MAVTNYYTVGGRMLGEKTSGGTRIDYVRDHLGSVVATTDSSGSTLNTYRYKPYGAQLAKTGVSADPKFLWVGQWGYRRAYSTGIFVRTRNLDTVFVTWSTIDRHWPSQKPYTYGDASPTNRIDFYGDQSCARYDPCRGCESWSNSKLCAVAGGLAGYDADKGALGFTACCSGKEITCWYPNKAEESYGCKDGDTLCNQIKACIDMHEGNHVRQAGDWCGRRDEQRKKVPSTCGVMYAPSESIGADMECEASVNTIALCIAKNWPDINCKVGAKGSVCAYIEAECRNLDRWCSLSGSGGTNEDPARKYCHKVFGLRK